MFNLKLLNFHDVLLIMAIVVIIHIVAHPLYDRIDGINGNDATAS